MTSVAMLMALTLGATDAGVPAADPARVEHFTHYLSWVLDVVMNEAQLASAAALVVRADAGGDPESSKVIDRAIELDAELAKETPTEAARLRSTVEIDYLRTLKRSKGKAAVEWIQSVAGARKTLHGAKPGLTRHAAECLLELSLFAAAKVGVAAPADARALRDAFARALTARWAAQPEEARTAAADAPKLWQRLRTAWPEATPEKRAELETAFKAVLAQPVKSADGLAALGPRLALQVFAWR